MVLATLQAEHPSIDARDLAFLREELSELDDRNQRLLSKAAGGGDEDEDEDEGADISHMKLWRMKDLGVQTVHSILRSEVRAGVC